jgi:hypothetical protein
VVVEDLSDDRPCAVGVGQEAVQLQHPRIIFTPEAAFDGDARAREGGEVAGAADEAVGGRQSTGRPWRGEGSNEG